MSHLGLNVLGYDGHFDGISKRLKEVGEEEASLLRSLARTRAEASRLKSERNRRASVSKLPDDVLAEIFAVAHRDDVESRDRKRTSLPFCMVASHVIRTWRVNAIRLSFLWTTIEVLPSHHIDLLQMYLSRIRSRLFDISFRFQSKNCEKDNRCAL